MSLSSVLNTCSLIVSSRVAFETTLRPRVRDLQTPSRLAGLVHGVLCSVELAEGNWSNAVQSTGLFFALDALLTLAYRRGLAWDTAFHHVLGMALCLFSVLTQSFDAGHFGCDVTRALILMEVSNPLLHLLVTLRKEGLQAKVPPLALQVMQGVFLMQFAGIRIGLLGHALYNVSGVLASATQFEMGMVWISLSMWTLQWMWFIKLEQARAK